MRMTILGVATAALVFVSGCSDSAPSTAGPGADSPPTPTASQAARPESPKSSSKDLAEDLELRGDWEELGPYGFLELRLGMSQEEALATHRITLGETVGQCTGFYLAMYGDALPGPHGYFTSRRGLTVIRGQDRMHTPEGVMYGTRDSVLRDSYADLVVSESYMTARASHRRAYYFVVDAHTVSDFGLASRGDPCLARALRH